MNILSDHMGNNFAKLAPLIKQAHTGSKVFKGNITVERGGILANIVCLIFKFPKANLDTRLVVECCHYSDRIDWARDFNGSKMLSEFRSENDYLVEKLGPLSMQFKALNNNGGIEYQFTRTKLFGIFLPSIFSPKIIAYEKEVLGEYHFFVSVSMRFIGLILSYGGALEISSPNALNRKTA